MGKVELNVGIDPELVNQARLRGIDISGKTEAQLRILLQKLDPAGGEARARRWAEENAEEIKAHNERIARRGLVSDHFRPA